LKIFLISKIKNLYDFLLTLKNMNGGKIKKSKVIKPTKTARKYKTKDGITRVLYEKGNNYYIRKKNKDGKFVFRKIKIAGS